MVSSAVSWWGGFLYTGLLAINLAMGSVATNRTRDHSLSEVTLHSQ